jgi:DNA polymerase III alpha subunit
MEADHSDETKMMIYTHECKKDNIQIIKPNVNNSTLKVTVTSDEKIALPLNTIKGVGNLAEVIIAGQPYESLKDMCFRSKPNRGIIESLATGGALSCFSEIKGKSVEYIMDLWDEYVKERKIEEAEAERLAKRKYVFVSPFAGENDENKEIVVNKKHFNKKFFDDIFGDF